MGKLLAELANDDDRAPRVGFSIKRAVCATYTPPFASLLSLEDSVGLPKPAARPKRTPPAHEWIFRSTFGHYRGRNRVFAHWALADGIFADGIFTNRRRRGGDRLRPWEVGSNCGSHESQRSDT
jgi:hypothetical protein